MEKEDRQKESLLEDDEGECTEVKKEKEAWKGDRKDRRIMWRSGVREKKS